MQTTLGTCYSYFLYSAVINSETLNLKLQMRTRLQRTLKLHQTTILTIVLIALTINKYTRKSRSKPYL